MTLVAVRRRRVVLATTPSDCHTWNLVYLQLLLEEANASVVNLGPCTPHRVVIDALADVATDLVVISTLNGHGWAEGQQLMQQIRMHSLDHPPVVIGGKLGCGIASDAHIPATLLAAGYRAVYVDSAIVPPEARPTREFPSDLRHLLTQANEATAR